MKRAATIASSVEAEQDRGSGLRCQDTILGGVDAQSSTVRLKVSTVRLKLVLYALTKSPTIYASLIEQFWQTAALSIIEDGVMAITATIDRKVKVLITEASIRRHLKLKDSEGLGTLPTKEIFEQLALMSPKETAWEQFSSNIAIAIICLATNTTFNFSKLIFNAMHQGDEPTIQTTFESSPSRIKSSPSLSPQHTPISSPSISQPLNIQTTPVAEEAALMPRESPLQSVHSFGRDEGSLSLNELTVLCTSLTKKVEGLESELKKTKQTYNVALIKLIKRVKKLEQTIKTSQAKRRTKVVIADDKEDEEDTSKQGRSLIEELDMDAAKVLADAAEQGRSAENVQTYTRRRREVSTGSGGVSTASELVSTAGVKAKDKGKAVMQESEPPKKIKKRV
ncbi:hypothetical protein Tco_1064801, partial [Tanacetum coccineum]